MALGKYSILFCKFNRICLDFLYGSKLMINIIVAYHDQTFIQDFAPYQGFLAMPMKCHYISTQAT